MTGVSAGVQAPSAPALASDPAVAAVRRARSEHDGEGGEQGDALQPPGTEQHPSSFRSTGGRAGRRPWARPPVVRSTETRFTSLDGASSMLAEHGQRLRRSGRRGNADRSTRQHPAVSSVEGRERAARTQHRHKSSCETVDQSPVDPSAEPPIPFAGAADRTDRRPQRRYRGERPRSVTLRPFLVP